MGSVGLSMLTLHCLILFCSLLLEWFFTWMFTFIDGKSGCKYGSPRGHRVCLNV